MSRSSPPAPLVSVVTPTRGRPDLLLSRALRSALAQTLRDIEIIVVVDGADPATEAALAGVQDARVRVIVLPQSVGGAEARNVGARAARADWVALLDDDDEWLPHKLEAQLALAQATAQGTGGRPIVACRWLMRTPHGDYPNPPRLPDPGEPLSEYMLARRTLLERTCGLVSTMLFMPRELLLDVPFTPGLPKHQDWDWLLRAAMLPDVGVVLVPDICAVWYYEEPRPSMSTQLDWRASLRWARRMQSRGTITRRAFVGFLNSHIVPSAQHAREFGAAFTLLPLLLAARPRPFELGTFAANFALPIEFRRRTRARLDRFLQRVRSGGEVRTSSPQVTAQTVDCSPPQTVALIDPLAGGHHGSYAATLAAELVGRGVHVHLIGPAVLVEEVCRTVPQVSGHVLPLFSSDGPEGREAYYRLGRVARDRVNLRFLRAALRQSAQLGAGTAHLLWLDSFVVPLLAARLGQPQRPPRLRATLHWAYFLRQFEGGGLSQRVHRALLGALGNLGVRVMMHSAQLTRDVGAGLLDAVPYPTALPQTAGSERLHVRQTVRGQMGIPLEATVLLAFGGTRHDKGGDLALEALALLPAHVHLLVVGPTRAFDAGALRQHGERLGIMDRLHLHLEHVPDEAVEGYFLAADACLLPYRRNFAGQSGPLLIAASLGLPVLAADVGVLAETVQEYGLGALFAPEDPAALARCVSSFDAAIFAPDTARFQRDHTPQAFAEAVLNSYSNNSSSLG
ncbi:glycosyltransferase [Deinococcus arenicola]|uniref:Glycosyltransferase n=1 Tax=Deinococcus arenicola TaxID=2994950 RepID=A0ABU4DSE6_9DEIO|nr:glycosyltransferase [Deinococcus sp. ZS9-10]MDV6375361.1 glycosyltransferase [Deinococcus sp. ZS9-10]